MSIYAHNWKFFQTLRKRFDLTEQLFGAESPSWDEWQNTMKAKSPLGYFLVERIPTYINRAYDLTLGNYHKVRYYALNRFSRRRHMLPTGLAKGTFHSVKRRMMHGCFETLVDFVEIDCAQSHVNDLSFNTSSYGRPFWHRLTPFRWKDWRCPEAGIAHIHWCMSLDDPRADVLDIYPLQADNFRLIFELYYWWKHERPFRPDPFEASGTADLYRKRQAEHRDLLNAKYTPEEIQEQHACFDRQRQIEEAYDKEDEEMFERLIKNRDLLSE